MPSDLEVKLMMMKVTQYPYLQYYFYLVSIVEMLDFSDELTKMRIIQLKCDQSYCLRY